MEARLDGARRDAEHGCRLLERQLEVVTEDDDGALLRLEPSQGPIEEIAIRQEGGGVGHRKVVQGSQLHLDDVPSPVSG